MGEGLELVVLRGLGVGELEDADVGELATEVDVAGESAILDRDALEAGDLHVLADDVNHLGELVGDRGAGHRAGLERLDVAGVVIGDDLGEGGRKPGELGVGAHEVGLAGELEDGARLAVIGDVDGDGALVGVAASTLDGLGDAHRTEDVDGLLDVTVSLDECLLALHHRGVGHLAELLDECGGNLCHDMPLLWGSKDVESNLLGRGSGRGLSGLGSGSGLGGLGGRVGLAGHLISADLLLAGTGQDGVGRELAHE